MTLSFSNTDIAKPVTARVKINDRDRRNGVKGLYVSMNKGGTRTFHLRYWVKEKVDYDYVEIGEFIAGAFGVDDARAEAKRLLAHRTLNKVDLAAERRKERGTKAVDASKADKTFNEVADEFETFCKKPVDKPDGGKRPRIEDWQSIAKSLRPPRAAFGHKRFSEVTEDDILSVIKGYWDAGKNVRGNKVRAVLMRVYRWGCETGRKYTTPQLNPCIGLPSPEPVARKQRALNPDEVRRLWWGPEKKGAPCERREVLFFRMMLSTGLRPGGETAGALRGEIVVSEEGGREYHVPLERGKKRRPICCPLNGLAAEIIDELLALPANREQSLFPLGAQGGRLNTTIISNRLVGGGLLDFLGFNVPRKDKRNIPFSHFSAHDLRATVATLLQMDGVSAADIALVLDHQKTDKDAPSATAGYMRAQQLAHIKRPLLERLEQLIRMSIDPARPEGMSLHVWKKKAKAEPAVDVAALQRQIADLQAQVSAATSGKVVRLGRAA